MIEKTDKKSGFFKPHYDKIRSSISNETFETFSKLDNNEARVKLVYELKTGNELNLNLNTNLKDLDTALQLKLDGNNEFQKDNFKNALKFYNKSYLLTPYQSEKEMSIILANRSAALQHLEEYRLALIDIKMSLQFKYPEELHYKLYERKAKCLLALKQNVEALEAFKLTLKSLDKSKITSEKRQKIQMDVQIMIKMLTKSNELIKAKPSKDVSTIEKTRNNYLPKVSGNQNKMFTGASDLVKIQYSKEFGRYAVAAKDVNAGNTLVVEKAHCAVLLKEFALTHCQHCFLRVKAPISCKICSNVVFCSELCRSEATYHSNECNIWTLLWTSGASIICIMALRLLTQRSLSFFLNIKSELTRKITIENNKLYDGSDYFTAFNLVSHEQQRTQEDFFHRTNMAVFLLNCLEKTNFFQTPDGGHLQENSIFIGALLLHHLQLLQFNAHEISELQMRPDKPNRVDLAKSIFLGGGLYPTLALFNHSCDPGIIRYFHGTSIIARAAKNIRTGEIIAENYGPIFTETPINERKKILKQQYWFDCHCIACLQNWPLFDKMDSSVLRFRCDGSVNCPNVILVPGNSDQFMILCGLCGQHTNILKGLKALQDTDMMFKTATRFLENGQCGQALAIFLQILSLLYNTLAPPFKDYHLCQEGIRKCMLDYGNKSIPDI